MLYSTRNRFRLPESFDYIDITDLTENWDLIDTMVAKCNYVATLDPTANDDSVDGYSVGSIWFNITDGKIFYCLDNTIAAAVWSQVLIAGSDIDFGSHELRAQTLYLDKAIGTAPMTITSTTKVNNLNVDMVDGKHSTDIILANGSVPLSNGLIMVNQLGFPTLATGQSTIVAGSDGKPWYKTYGGAETQILTGALATAENDFLVASGSGTFVKKTLAETKTLLGASAFWETVPGTPTRVSDTQFTITDTSNANKYDKIFTKGTILKWYESTTLCMGMIVSASYATNTVTINLVGNTLSVGFTSLKYCKNRAQKIEWIIPGTIGTGTNVGRTHFADCDLIKLSVDIRVKTAGATGSTTIDINDDGTSIMIVKPSISDTGTSDLDNYCDNPPTVIAQNSAITVDVDAVTTTAPVDLYVVLFVCPEAWRYIE